ncbi:BZ3501_MvSof-1269-A2-R1_Chr12-1g03349 [Microbotryum saponariae]|nr:BZ3501_MvSof-1269-A2-R1_Chr12-1g03349 [Microbotryum saponariae]
MPRSKPSRICFGIAARYGATCATFASALILASDAPASSGVTILYIASWNESTSRAMIRMRAEVSGAGDEPGAGIEDTNGTSPFG